MRRRLDCPCHILFIRLAVLGGAHSIDKAIEADVLLEGLDLPSRRWMVSQVCVVHKCIGEQTHELLPHAKEVSPAQRNE